MKNAGPDHHVQQKGKMEIERKSKKCVVLELRSELSPLKKSPYLILAIRKSLETSIKLYIHFRKHFNKN